MTTKCFLHQREHRPPPPRAGALKGELTDETKMAPSGTVRPESNLAGIPSLSTPIPSLSERDRQLRSQSSESTSPSSHQRQRRLISHCIQNSKRSRPKKATTEITGAMFDIETTAVMTPGSDAEPFIMQFLDSPAEPRPPAAPPVPPERGKVPDTPPGPVLDR